jgi:putative FmdB family regulatory protein
MLKLILSEEVRLPLYEYRCRKCGRLVEKIQKFSDPPLKTCKTCGGPLERVLSAPAIQFKGSGWYVTDYARKSRPESPGSKGDGGAGANASKPAESKPAASASETKTPSKK